ncbi:MAG: DUF255 domain-containing protein [Dehalococcoidia bacterium]
MSDEKFHFSPRPNRAADIAWSEWGEDAFQRARDSGKPILLSLSAVWCHWCHVMDETTYSDEGVITFINQHFVPVRVDNDQRPDINARYNMGGWPTTAFLTPEGETLAGATYIAPDQMKEVLPKVYTHFVSNRDEITQKAIELREKRAEVYQKAAGELTATIFQDILRSVMNNYDPLYGGFGEAPKFPHTDAIDLLLYAHRRTGDPDSLHMARKTLEMMYAGEVYDREWNGFFRYATRRDWSEPHYEKMLEDEAGLLRNALGLYRITGEEGHRAIAEGIVEYIEWKLRDPDLGYFYGSQDADEEFYKLDAERRMDFDEPYIDRTCYTSWNAQMISAYLEASWTLDRPDLLEHALLALAVLRDRLFVDGIMYRFLDSTEAPQIPGLLGDQSHTALAMLDAYEVCGDSAYLDDAVRLADLLEARYFDAEAGGFWDVTEGGDGLGRLQERQKSVQENAVVAEMFFRLGHLTREDKFLAVLKKTLQAFVGLYPEMGYFASGYATCVDLLLNPPLQINIVGGFSNVSTLHRAALSLGSPARIVQVLDPARDSERLAQLVLPAEPSPAAYVCSGSACSAPASDVDQLLAAVRQMRALDRQAST